MRQLAPPGARPGKESLLHNLLRPGRCSGKQCLPHNLLRLPVILPDVRIITDPLPRGHQGRGGACSRPVLLDLTRALRRALYGHVSLHTLRQQTRDHYQLIADCQDAHAFGLKLQPDADTCVEGELPDVMHSYDLLPHEA